MAIKKEFTFRSRDGINTCYAYSWAPENGNIKAVFQIIHGMVEYVQRYDAFASFLAAHGYLVVGEDHLGHGKTAATEKDLGYFCPQDPETVLVRNAHRLKKIIQEQNPGVPYFIMGHSMGSFIFRKYLTMYGSGIDGAIVMGTGVMPAFVTGFGVFLTNFQKVFFGDRHVSGFITHIAFGGYNKRIPDCRTESDWISRDDDVVDAYVKDPLCSFKFSLNAYRTLFKILGYVCKEKNLTTIPDTLPIFVVAGTADPVGNYGKGPKAVYEQYKRLGIKDVTLKLYDGFRHEILNEIGREEPYRDILNWLDAHCAKENSENQ